MVMPVMVCLSAYSHVLEPLLLPDGVVRNRMNQRGSF